MGEDPGTRIAPEPLPLPEPTPYVADKRVRTGVRVAAVVLVSVVIVACGFAIAGLGAYFSPFTPLFGGFTETGVMQMHWAGDGRYAVVEYVGSGKDATTSVIAWDAETNRTVRADGFRLVAVEPSSTQVWLTRAPSQDQEWAAPGIEEVTYEGEDEYSPWEDPVMSGMPPSDGPGTPWVWDVAAGGTPQRPSDTSWRQWRGPAGITAKVAVSPANGLYPSSVTFSEEGTDPAVWQTKMSGTFLPIGWSPSGRYFAVRRPEGVENAAVTIIDARTGQEVAEVIDPGMPASYGEDDEPPTSYGGISGAAWDTTTDTVCVLRYDTTNDGETNRVSIRMLAASGGSTEVAGAPAQWRSSWNQPTLLGTDADGVLVCVETESGTKLWHVRGGRILSAGEFTPDRGAIGGEGTYSARRRLLVTEYPEVGVFSSGSDSSAAVTDLRGRTTTTFWPPK